MIKIRQLVLLVLLLFSFSFLGLWKYDISISILSIIVFIFLLSLLEIIKDYKNHSFSLIIVHWLFIIFFMCIAPFIQIASNYYPWGIKYEQIDCFYSLFIVFVWSISFYLGSKCLGYYKCKKIVIPFGFCRKHNNLMILLDILSFLVLILLTGFSNIFSRATNGFDLGAKSLNLLAGKILRASITFMFYYFLYEFLENRKFNIYTIISFFCFIFGCFPFGLARNEMGAIYLGMIFILFNSKIRKHSSPFLIISFVIAFSILFPAVNVFRNLLLSADSFKDSISSVVNNLGAVYLSEDYDAFSMLMNTITYVQNFGLTYGRQFLGVLLFFVPRSIWPTKPIGSGALVFSYLHPSFTNVSCPIFAEFYINWGFLGVVIGGFLLGGMLKYIDKVYFSCRKGYLKYCYPIIIGFLFFLMRGDLLSSWSFLFGYCFTFYILYKVFISRIIK